MGIYARLCPLGFRPEQAPPHRSAAPRGGRPSAEPPLALSKIAARSSPTQPPMEEAPVTIRLVVQGKERTVGGELTA